MTIDGPFIAGGGYQNNATQLALPVTAAIPEGALALLVVGTDAAAADTIAVNDSAGNAYDLLTRSKDPNSPATIMLFAVPSMLALAAGQTVTLVPSRRVALGGSLYFHTGEIVGSIVSYTKAWGSTATPQASIFSYANCRLFATVAVVGPSSDTFTPDPNWGPDVVSGVASTLVTVHASGRDAAATGQHVYAPVLSAARRSVLLGVAFQ